MTHDEEFVISFNNEKELTEWLTMHGWDVEKYTNVWKKHHNFKSVAPGHMFNLPVEDHKED